MKLENIKSYALILIYPDGYIEKVKRDDRQFHMEYFIELAETKARFKEIINQKNIYIPDKEEAIFMLTYEMDYKLAKDGIIVIHNLFLDEELRKEISGYSCDYYISMPDMLSNRQKEIMSDTIESYDISNCWFASIINNILVDINYQDVLTLINKKIK